MAKGARLSEHRNMAGRLVQPIGVFRARVTRDGAAHARDGEPYFEMNRVTESHPPKGARDLYEIRFSDGSWMLAREDDLVAGVIGVRDTGV